MAAIKLLNEKYKQLQEEAEKERIKAEEKHSSVTSEIGNYSSSSGTSVMNSLGKKCDATENYKAETGRNCKPKVKERESDRGKCYRDLKGLKSVEYQWNNFRHRAYLRGLHGKMHVKRYKKRCWRRGSTGKYSDTSDVSSNSEILPKNLSKKLKMDHMKVDNGVSGLYKYYRIETWIEEVNSLLPTN